MNGFVNKGINYQYPVTGFENLNTYGVGSVEPNSYTPTLLAPHTGAYDNLTGKMNFMDELKNTPWLGSTNSQGIKQMGLADYGLGALSAGLSAFMGMKQYGLAKKQFDFQKDAWNKEFDTAGRITNSRLADRQDRRVAEAGNMAAWTGSSAKPRSTADYMAQYGVKTNG
jgi:hypothetical protein